MLKRLTALVGLPVGEFEGLIVGVEDGLVVGAFAHYSGRGGKSDVRDDENMQSIQFNRRTLVEIAIG